MPVTAAPPPQIPPHVTIWSVQLPGEPLPLSYGDLHTVMHRDIGLGNDYRKERIKHLTTLATGVFALTVTFHKDLLGGSNGNLELVLLFGGWLLLLISLYAGIIHLRRWEDYYLAYGAMGSALWRHQVADAKDKPKAAAAWHEALREREKHQSGYRHWSEIQTASLLAGMALLAIYVATSLLVR